LHFVTSTGVKVVTGSDSYQGALSRLLCRHRCFYHNLVSTHYRGVPRIRLIFHWLNGLNFCLVVLREVWELSDLYNSLLPSISNGQLWSVQSYNGREASFSVRLIAVCKLWVTPFGYVLSRGF
jgi:hypothetical protein